MCLKVNKSLFSSKKTILESNKSIKKKLSPFKPNPESSLKCTKEFTDKLIEVKDVKTDAKIVFSKVFKKTISVKNKSKSNINQDLDQTQKIEEPTVKIKIKRKSKKPKK